VSGNRKAKETYRFNGNPFLHAHSIHSVEIPELKLRVEEFTRKLADPNDADDPKWTKRWLDRFQRELDKKTEAIEVKRREKSKQTDRSDPMMMASRWYSNRNGHRNSMWSHDEQSDGHEAGNRPFLDGRFTSARSVIGCVSSAEQAMAILATSG
jgi:hypothetical protein